MGISFEKWTVMGILTILSIILGLIPYYIFRYTNSSFRSDATVYKIITVLACFGGGVLLSTALIHVLPEVRFGLQHIPVIWKIFDVNFPVAEMFLLCGFALIYLIEEIAHYILVDGHHFHNHKANSVVRHNSIAHGIPLPNRKNSRSLLALPNEGQGIGLSPAICTPTELGMDKISGDNEENECPDDKVNFRSSFRQLMALVALSFHAIMEGVAIGIQVIFKLSLCYLSKWFYNAWD
jgi:zinc transporter 1/2/3